MKKGLFVTISFATALLLCIGFSVFFTSQAQAQLSDDVLSEVFGGLDCSYCDSFLQGCDNQGDYCLFRVGCTGSQITTSCLQQRKACLGSSNPDSTCIPQSALCEGTYKVEDCMWDYSGCDNDPSNIPCCSPDPESAEFFACTGQKTWCM
ncbi:MAG: hypothetical protein KAQ68_11595 [Clostridiales bacterium]|nr:hypothetical protein [Clostridiales bacterium]